MSCYSVTVAMQHRSMARQAENKKSSGPNQKPPPPKHKPAEPQIQGRKVTKQLNEAGHFLNGVVANSAMSAVMQPFFTIKTYVMNKQGLPPLSKLYNGLNVSLINGGAAEGITFLSHHLLTYKPFSHKAPVIGDGENLAASFVSGGLGAVVVSPCERIMIRQQLHGGSIRSAMQFLTQKEGWFKGMTKGMVPTAVRDGKYNLAIFALNDIGHRESQSYIPEQNTREVAVSGGCGAVVGVASAPWDRVKTLMQADTDGIYTSTCQTAKKIVEQEGVVGLFRGAGSRAAAVGGAAYCVTKSKKEAPQAFPSACFVEK